MTNSTVKTYDDDHDDNHIHDGDYAFDDHNDDADENDEISKGVQWARTSDA